MKKEFINITIEVIKLKNEDIIKTSGFGNSYAGEEDEEYEEGEN